MTPLAHIPIERLDAVIFDMDGVVTDTASLHAIAWRRLFNEYLRRHTGNGAEFQPFSEDDYLRYVDGKPRYEGVQSFLGARGISLDLGAPSDPPGDETVCALGNKKDVAFAQLLDQTGARAFASTVRLIHLLKEHHVHTAVISSSRHARAVLASAGVQGLFDVTIDGAEAAAMQLPGKPDPAIFLAAAKRLGVQPARAGVVEDALAGVEAGRRGGFGLVIGVDRHGHPTDLKTHGADIVVSDLGEIELDQIALR